MSSFVYNVAKAPTGWSLFRDRERIGAYGSKEAALEAATAAGADALREGHSIQINVPGSDSNELEKLESPESGYGLRVVNQSIKCNANSACLPPNDVTVLIAVLDIDDKIE